MTKRVFKVFKVRKSNNKRVKGFKKMLVTGKTYRVAAKKVTRRICKMRSRVGKCTLKVYLKEVRRGRRGWKSVMKKTKSGKRKVKVYKLKIKMKV
tara:strand:+ start:55 stop:339 length:285 start_codon:yes stop_codon:yes gene_type:complete